MSRYIGRLGVRILSGICTGLITGTYRALGDKGLKMMIKKNWHTIPSILYALEHGVSPEVPKSDRNVLEAYWMRIRPVVNRLLREAERIVSRIPREEIERGIDDWWVKRRLEEKAPEILERIKSIEGGMEWLRQESVILREFLMGRRKF